MQEIEGGTFDPEAQWQAKCEKLHAEHPEYSSEAYRFVQKSILQDYFKRDAEPPKGSRSFSALLESCQDYAKEVYGASAKAQLKSWGIETYLDVGEILILNGSGGIKGEIDLALESRLQKVHDTLRENLRRKYGESPFLSNEL